MVEDCYFVLQRRRPELECEDRFGNVLVYEGVETCSNPHRDRAIAVRNLPSTIGKKLPLTNDVIVAKEFPLEEGDVDMAVDPKKPYLFVAKFLGKRACVMWSDPVTLSSCDVVEKRILAATTATNMLAIFPFLHMVSSLSLRRVATTPTTAHTAHRQPPLSSCPTRTILNSY